MEENYRFYEEIMTYTIRYGVLRSRYPDSEKEMDALETEMRAFIKKGLGVSQDKSPNK